MIYLCELFKLREKIYCDSYSFQGSFAPALKFVKTIQFFPPYFVHFPVDIHFDSVQKSISKVIFPNFARGWQKLSLLCCSSEGFRKPPLIKIWTKWGLLRKELFNEWQWVSAIFNDVLFKTSFFKQLFSECHESGLVWYFETFLRNFLECWNIQFWDFCDQGPFFRGRSLLVQSFQSWNETGAGITSF